MASFEGQVEAERAMSAECPPALKAPPLAAGIFTTNSPYSFSCGSSSCCTSRGPSQVCPPHLYQRSPRARVPPSPHRSRAARTSPMVPCVRKRPERARQRLRSGPLPCPQRPAAPVPWTPRCTFVPTPIVPIAVGEDWGICGPMAIPVAARGGSSTASAATGISQSITARSCMASKRRWS